MLDYKSALSRLSNGIHAFSQQAQQGNWSSAFQALYQKLAEIDYKGKANEIYSHTSELLSGSKKKRSNHLKRPDGSRKIKSSPSTLRVGVHHSKESAEPVHLDPTAGMEALALAGERYALESQSQFAERRRALATQEAEIMAQLKQLEDKHQKLCEMLDNILAQQAELMARDGNTTSTSSPHPSNNLYG
ncbi:MAG TPA: hypothetical protein VEC35_25625 [Noviherbaspirillum sp.]|nr:hypothetical protein [Noviherbaspirillum sp.]